MFELKHEEVKEQQLFCSRCGKTNWSAYFTICECEESDFKFETHEEFLESHD